MADSPQPEQREDTTSKKYSKKKKDKRDVAVSPEAVKELLKLKKEQQEFCQKHNIKINVKI